MRSDVALDVACGCLAPSMALSVPGFQSDRHHTRGAGVGIADVPFLLPNKYDAQCIPYIPT